MPKKLDSCVKKVQKKGKDKSSAYAICTSSLQKSGQMPKAKPKPKKKKK